MSRLRGPRPRPEGWGCQMGLLGDGDETYLLPCLDLGISVDVRSVGERPSRRVDGGGLGYQEGPRERRTLCVVVHTELGVDVVLVRPSPGERGKDDAMGEGQSPDLEGSEEGRRFGGRRHVSVEWSF